MKRFCAGVLALCVAGPAGAQDAALMEKIQALEERVQQLESEQAAEVDRVTSAAEQSRAADWTRRVRLGGSADAGFFGGQPDSLYTPDGFKIWDSRTFIDASLGQDVRMGETLLFRDIGFSFEWNLVRLGDLENDVGELFAEFQGVAGSDWANLQVGRFQIPVGEAYLLYSRGYASRWFVSNTFGPWWWDEGIKAYGSSSGSEDYGKFGYVASVSDGDTPFNTETDGDKQLTLKLFWDPTSWLHLSASALRTGELGNDDANASGALWLGETWARPIGAGSDQVVVQDGAEIAPAGPILHDTWFAGGDAIFDFADKARIWLSYGNYEMNARGGSTYDRTLHEWLAELILRGAWLGEGLRPFYAGFRAQGIGTYDDDEGYVLDMRQNDRIGYNMESLTQYSGVIGWDITPWLRMRSEYTRQKFDLVDGVRGVTNGDEIDRNARDADYYAIELGVSF
ncbi:MAG TPA: hypothetical protein VNF72_18540 [Myxococcota bacterium]|jgi:hypothetical protein|nr:hypothetical protein [Myxococcota bacterium]